MRNDSNRPFLKTLADSVTFWSIFPMLFDGVALWFGGSTFGPGLALGIAITTYSSGIRDAVTGAQYRPENPFSLLWLLAPIWFIYGSSVGMKIDRGKIGVAQLQLAELCLASVAFVACIHRVHRLPANPVKSVSEEWLSRKNFNEL